MKRIIYASLIAALSCTTASWSQNTGKHTVYFGDLTGQGGSNNSNFGYSAGNVVEGNYNTNFGSNSGLRLTTGINNINVGYGTGMNLGSASNNVNVGTNAGLKITTDNNINIGYDSGTNMATGTGNSIIGTRAGNLLTAASYNTFLGSRTGTNVFTTANGNTIVGAQTPDWDLELTTGGLNSCFGTNAGYRLSTGAYNTLLGFGCAPLLTDGIDNVALGNSSGGDGIVGSKSGLISQNYNTLLGAHTLDNANFSSNGNVALGYCAGKNYTFPSGKSLLILNNQAQISNPILYGYFAGNTNFSNPASSVTSQAQLAINTSAIKPNFSLTINGPTFLGDFGTDATNSTDVAASRFSSYYLWVERGVVSEDFAIGASTSWADYVFEPGYKLTPLAEVHRFIQENGHLPGIATAREVLEEGYSLHQNNVKLLEKVEELTLYAIESDKANKTLSRELQEVKAQLEEYKDLKSQVEELKALLGKK